MHRCLSKIMKTTWTWSQASPKRPMAPGLSLSRSLKAWRPSRTSTSLSTSGGDWEEPRTRTMTTTTKFSRVLMVTSQSQTQRSRLSQAKVSKRMGLMLLNQGLAKQPSTSIQKTDLLALGMLKISEPDTSREKSL